MNSLSITWALVAMMPGRTRNPVPTDPSPVIIAIDGSDSAAISAEESGRPGSARRVGATSAADTAGVGFAVSAGWLAGGDAERLLPASAGGVGCGAEAIPPLARGNSRPRASA